MGIFKLSAVFLLALLQWEVSSAILPKELKCPPLSSPQYISPCENTCSSLLDPTEVCRMVATYTCKCDDGLLAQIGTSGESVQCVKPEDCNITCGPNQHFDPCHFHCQPTCEQHSEPIICAAVCLPGCVCDEGFVRSGKNCIKPTECKKP